MAIVTGAGRDSGIGAAIVATLARNGASVAINYMSDATAPQAHATAERLCAAHGPAAAVAVQQDVESEEGAKSLVAKTLAAFGVDHVDIVINNAGCNLPGSTADTPLEHIHAQFSKNVFTAIYVVRAALPHIPRGGRIINISTISTKHYIEGLAFYSAAKSALDSLTHSWAAEVNTFPPFIDQGITLITLNFSLGANMVLPSTALHLVRSTRMSRESLPEITPTGRPRCSPSLMLPGRQTGWAALKM